MEILANPLRKVNSHEDIHVSRCMRDVCVQNKQSLEKMISTQHEATVTQDQITLMILYSHQQSIMECSWLLSSAIKY